MTTDLFNHAGALAALPLSDPKRVPDLPSKLIGRDIELIKIRGWLDSNARVLLQAGSGEGKTALAATVASRWLAGGKGQVLWLRAGTSSPETLFEALVRPFGLAGVANADTFRQTVQTREVKLLVLDDVGNSAALYTVLDALPLDIPALITARRPFPIDGALLELTPLTTDKALELLNLQRGVMTRLVIRRPNAPPAPPDDSDSARALCAQLDNRPFAVEIAGKLLQLRKRTPAELMAELDNFAVPADAEVPSVAALLDTVLRALPDDARRVLLAFGIFSQMTPRLLALLGFGVSEITDDLLNVVRKRIPREHLTEVEYRLSIQRMILEEQDTPRLQDALTRLTEYGLLKAVQEGYRVHSLTYSALKNGDAARAQALDRCLVYQQLYAQADSAAAEANNLAQAALWAVQQGRYSDAEQLVFWLCGAAGYLVPRGYAGIAAELAGYYRQVMPAEARVSLPDDTAPGVTTLPPDLPLPSPIETVEIGGVSAADVPLEATLGASVEASLDSADVSLEAALGDSVNLTDEVPSSAAVDVPLEAESAVNVTLPPQETQEIQAALPMEESPEAPADRPLVEMRQVRAETLYIEIQSATNPQPPFALLDDKITIGRSSKRDLRLDDPRVSRVHLQINRQPDNTVLLCDLYSASGTRLNDQTLTPGIPAVWSIGQEVTLGSTRLTLRAGKS